MVQSDASEGGQNSEKEWISNERVEILNENLNLGSEIDPLKNLNSDDLKKWINSDQIPDGENRQEVDSSDLENLSIEGEKDNETSIFVNC